MEKHTVAEQALIAVEKLYTPLLYLKFGLMKNFMKVVDRNGKVLRNH